MDEVNSRREKALCVALANVELTEGGKDSPDQEGRL